MPNYKRKSVSLTPKAFEAVNARRAQTLENFSKAASQIIEDAAQTGARVVVDMRDTPRDFPVLVPMIFQGRWRDGRDDHGRPVPYGIGMVDMETCTSEAWRAVDGPVTFPMSSVVA